MNGDLDFPRVSDSESGVAPGTVYLVGAGPGDRRLITLWGIECLRQADVVLYDYLVDVNLLEHAPPTAQRIPLGHHSRGRFLSQAEVNEIVVSAAKSGKTVVRLKGGDPLVFGRFAEEAAFLRKHAVPVVIIPGVTAALAAASLAEIPLTHADQASAVAFIAGSEHSSKTESHLDYEVLARFPGTLVYYMGVRSAASWSRQLMEHGRAPETPVAIVRRCGWPEQKTYRTTLSELAAFIDREGIKPPAVIIVGETARDIPLKPWYVRQPLFGESVLVTRAEDQAGELRRLLEAQGAYVLVQPAIEIAATGNTGPLDGAIRDLASHRWVVFTSANGVRFFMERVFALGYDARVFASTRIAAIGPGTARALERFGLRTDLIPEEYRAERLAEALNALPERGRVLLVRASRGRPVLRDELAKADWEVTQVVAYDSRDVSTVLPEILERLEEGKIQWVTATSPAIAESLVRLLGPYLGQLRIASISPVTSEVLREHGWEPTVEAREYTMRGLVAAIVQWVRRHRE